MAAKGLWFVQDLVKLIFNPEGFSVSDGTTAGIPGIAQNAATPVDTLYVSLHTGVSGSLANQTGSPFSSNAEATYSGYERLAVPRSSAGWYINGTSVFPVAALTFSAATSGDATLTYFAIGTEPTGSGTNGYCLYWGPLSTPINCADGVVPVLDTTSFISES